MYDARTSVPSGLYATDVMVIPLARCSTGAGASSRTAYRMEIRRTTKTNRKNYDKRDREGERERERATEGEERQGTKDRETESQRYLTRLAHIINARECILAAHNCTSGHGVRMENCHVNADQIKEQMDSRYPTQTM